MKLLFALPGFHRYDRGAEVALLAVATELARSGDDVCVVGSGDQRAGAAYKFRRIPSVRRERFESFPVFPPFRSEIAWEDATFAASLALHVPVSDYDATITCSFPFTHWALRYRGGKKTAHVFVTQNGDWPAYSDRSEYHLFRCDGLICTNPDYEARNRHKWRTELIPNGVDVERFRHGHSERARFGLPTDQRIILMVSAFIESKRVLEGIRAAATIENAYLVVAGDGPLRQEARDLADQLLPGRYAQFSIAAADMPALYQSADVFLHMSLLESFGNVYLEAWASGLPIVAHDSARLRWILGEDQFLCDTQVQDQLTVSLRSALSAPTPRTVAGLERFAWPAVAAEYRRFIKHIVDHNQRTHVSS